MGLVKLVMVFLLVLLLVNRLRVLLLFQVWWVSVVVGVSVIWLLRCVL